MESINRKKYIVVTPFFPSPDRWQGAYILDQVKAIQRHSDYEVVVFKTHSINDYEKDYEIQGIRVHCIRPLLMPSYILNGLTDNLVGKIFTKQLKQLNISPSSIAFIHCHTCNHAAFGLGVKKLDSNVKVILQFHDPDPLTLRNGKWANVKLNRRFRARKSIKTIESVDLVVCVSENVKDVLLSFPSSRKYEVYEPALAITDDIKDFPAISPRMIYVLNNGVNLELFKHLELSQKDIYRIGCIGNFVDWKNQLMLVKAFEILLQKGHTDMRLSLLGSGPTHTEIENFIEEHSMQSYVEWPHEIHHEKLPAYYNTLDLFVLPSRFEGFGCVYTEAYACGVPFICCENQGASECICENEENLWLVHDNDSLHLATLIERHYTERNKQHLCKEIDIDRLIPEYLTFIKEKLNG